MRYKMNLKTSVKSLLQRYRHDASGNFSIIGALSLIPILGMTSLSVDLGNVHSTRIKNQTFSDSIALSAALSYAANQNEARMIQTAKDVGLAMGLDTSLVTAELSTSPKDPNAIAIKIQISAVAPLFFAGAVGGPETMNINVTSFAELPSNPSTNCIIALNGGIRLSTSGQLGAVGCGVAARDDISLSTGGIINAESVNVGGQISQGRSGGTVTTSPTPGNIFENLPNPVRDPFEGVTEVDLAFARIGAVETPSVISVDRGSDMRFPSRRNSYNFQGVNISKVGGVWRVPSGTYAIRNLNVSGENIVFASPSTITVSGGISATQNSRIDLGTSNVAVSGRVRASGGSVIFKGPGRFFAGSMDVSLSGSAIIIGNGDVDIAGDVSVGNSGQIILGVGDKIIGGDIDASTSGVIRFDSGDLDIVGGIRLSTSASFRTGATAETHINGNIRVSTNSSINFGPSRYFIDDNIRVGTSSEFVGTSVSFFVNGDVDLSTGGATALAAPANDGGPTLDTILFGIRRANSEIRFSTNGDFGLEGTFYVPNSELRLNTSGAINGGDQCIVVVAKDIVLSTSGGINTLCDNLSEAFNSGAGSFSTIQIAG